ncbi:MAG TPA: sporulation peptidase YabG [Bacillales bacterium]|nr:sporulation peptidase YabG [Bacillales bacterium]
MDLKPGDIVARRSYGCDVLFRVVRILEQEAKAELSGEELRLFADAPIEDLVPISSEELQERQKKIKKREIDSYRLFRQDYQLLKMKREYSATGGYAREDLYFELPGKVLHIDGDPNYLKKCLDLYDKLGVPVYGQYLKETEMPKGVTAWVEKIKPNILVLTGHDAYLKNKGATTDLNAYRHSRDFVTAVQEARSVVRHPDHLVIFAGACQSHFEALIRAGANYASSPSRVNIHALDPVYIAAKVSLTSFMDRIKVWEALRNTITGEKGLGGIETKGILRTGMPIRKNPNGSDFQMDYLDS